MTRINSITSLNNILQFIESHLDVISLRNKPYCVKNCQLSHEKGLGILPRLEKILPDNISFF